MQKLMCVLSLAIACGTVEETREQATVALSVEWSATIDAAIGRRVQDFRAEWELHVSRLVQACNSSDCQREAEEEALGEAVTSNAGPIGADDTPLHAALLDVGPEPVRSALLERYRTASGRVERLAILQFLLRTRQLDPRRLEDDLMLRFFETEASHNERATLLELHRVFGVSASIGPLLADWCLNASRGDALHCLAALGHPDTADDFDTILTRLRTTPTRSLAMHGGDGVARCGAPCVHIIEELTVSSEKWDRHMAYYASARSPAQPLRDAMAALIVPENVLPNEAPYVERALGLDWRDFVAHQRRIR